MMTPQQVHGLQQEMERLPEKLVQRVVSLKAYPTSQSSPFIVTVTAGDGVAAASAHDFFREFCREKQQIKPVHVSLPQQVHGPQQKTERLRAELIQRVLFFKSDPTSRCSPSGCRCHCRSRCMCRSRKLSGCWRS